MIKAIDVKAGNILKFDGMVYKVSSVDYKGSAKAQKLVHLQLKSVPEGKFLDKVLQPDDKVDNIEPERHFAKFMYKDADDYYFMDNENYEQFPIPKGLIGEKDIFLKENDEIQINFYSGKPIEAVFPDRIKLKVTEAPPGIKEADTTAKSVKLENGLEVDVPQFINEGDTVEVDVETKKYIDRVKEDKA